MHSVTKVSGAPEHAHPPAAPGRDLCEASVYFGVHVCVRGAVCFATGRAVFEDVDRIGLGRLIRAMRSGMREVT